MRIELVNPQKVILEEIAGGATQESVALTYAFIIRQEPNADWPTINAAIRNRWKGKSALMRIKELAWKHVTGGRP